MAVLGAAKHRTVEARTVGRAACGRTANRHEGTVDIAEEHVGANIDEACVYLSLCGIGHGLATAGAEH